MQNMFEANEPNTNPTEPKPKTTLVIENVPSEIGYGILVSSLEKGIQLSPEELREKTNERLNNGPVTINFREWIEFFNKQSPLLTDEIFDRNITGDLNYIGQKEINPEIKSRIDKMFQDEVRKYAAPSEIPDNVQSPTEKHK